jgi:hypothetical protein
VSDLELDLSVGGKRDVPRLSAIDVAVEQRRHPSGVGSDPSRAKRLSPHVEEVTEREGAGGRRLNVDDSVCCVRMHSAEAGAAAHVGSSWSGRNLRGADPDPIWNATRCPVDEDGQVRVNVEQELLGV